MRTQKSVNLNEFNDSYSRIPQSSTFPSPPTPPTTVITLPSAERERELSFFKSPEQLSTETCVCLFIDFYVLKVPSNVFKSEQG